eukprot:885437-Amphidinium_carterae.1
MKCLGRFSHFVDSLFDALPSCLTSVCCNFETATNATNKLKVPSMRQQDSIQAPSHLRKVSSVRTTSILKFLTKHLVDDRFEKLDSVCQQVGAVVEEDQSDGLSK